MPHYGVYGLNIESGIELPGLLPGDESGLPDVRIHEDSIAESLPISATGTRSFEAQPQRVLVRLPGIGHLLITDGNQIRVSLDAQDKRDALALFILNHGLAVLLMQRGILVLHAGVVLFNGKTVVIAGDTGSGKSTLLAYLQQQGGKVLADEHCALDPGRGLTHPLSGAASMQLWQPVIEELDLPAANLTPVRQGFQKYFVPLDQPVDVPPLSALYVLNWQEKGLPQKKLISGGEKFSLLRQQVYQWPYVEGMGLAAEASQSCMTMAAQVDVFQLARTKELDQLQASADLLWKG